MRLIFSLLLLALSSTTLADAKQNLTARLQKLESLQGEFEQVITSDKGKTLQTSQGTFTMKRPGYFLWRTQAPHEQLVVGNPDKLWVYDPDLEQVTIRQGAAKGDNSPARLLSGDIASLAPQFSIQEASPNHFTLTPKNPAAENFAQIQFDFEGDKLVLMAFVDKLGQQTRLNLKNTQANLPLDIKLFTFEPKPGTDIIQND